MVSLADAITELLTSDPWRTTGHVEIARVNAHYAEAYDYYRQIGMDHEEAVTRADEEIARLEQQR